MRGASFVAEGYLDSRQWHIQSTSDKVGRRAALFYLVCHEEPILVNGVIGPSSPTGLAGRKLTSGMLFEWPSTRSEARCTIEYAVRQPHYPIHNQVVIIAAVGRLDFEAQIPHEGPSRRTLTLYD